MVGWRNRVRVMGPAAVPEAHMPASFHLGGRRLLPIPARLRSRPGRLRRLIFTSMVGVAIFGAVSQQVAAESVAALPDQPTVPRLGRPAGESHLAAATPTIYPDGEGLPAGQGDVATGQAVYARACAACHGSDGRGATADALAGGEMPLDAETPDKVIGTYWPYATTLFDFIRRAMPLSAPKSLSDNEVYAVTAYLLFLNGVVGDATILDAAALAAIRMPNRDGFIWIDVPPELRAP